jgi:Na+/H+ antiporter NhaA
VTSERGLELLLGNLGTLVLALLIIWAFLRGWIVPGFLYQALARERDRLFEIAVPIVKVMDRAATTLRERNKGDGLEG